MAQDKTIPLGEPGVASFESETWGNTPDLLFSDTPQVATHTYTVTSTTDVTFPLGAVVAFERFNGRIAYAVFAESSNATHITAAPIVLAAGESFSVPLYEAGHFRQQALTFDASFNTDDRKQGAFYGTVTPMILISKAQYTSDGVNV